MLRSSGLSSVFNKKRIIANSNIAVFPEAVGAATTIDWSIKTSFLER